MYHAPAKKHGVTVLLAGIDSLYLVYYGTLQPEVHALLRQRLEAALESRKSKAPKGVPITLGGIDFELQPFSSRTARYVLRNDDLFVRISEFSGSSYPSVYVQPCASFLWALGAPRAARRIREWVHGLQIREDREVVSRVDLAADLHGLAPHPDQLERYVSQSDKRFAFIEGLTWTGFQFGKGDVVARHYDKTAEIALTYKDWYPDLWRRSPAYQPDQSVARVEFQFRRGAFRSFVPRIDSFEDLWDRRGTLWRYAVERWLTLRIPLQGVQRTRWPLDPAWEAVQDVEFEGGEAPLVRERRRAASVDQLIPQVTGNLSSLAALTGKGTLEEILGFLRAKVPQYLSKRETSFSERVKAKQFRHAEFPQYYSRSSPHG